MLRNTYWPWMSSNATWLAWNRPHCGVDSSPSNEIDTSSISTNTLRLTLRSNGDSSPPANRAARARRTGSNPAGPTSRTAR